ncbi:MAG: hypothetical protein RLZZ173_620 [Pseudomonadota bacterium]
MGQGDDIAYLDLVEVLYFITKDCFELIAIGTYDYNLAGFLINRFELTLELNALSYF